MKGFDLIVPTIAEQQATGFIYAVEKTVGGKSYRFEAWNGEENVRCQVDGKPRVWAELGRRDREIYNAATATLGNFIRSNAEILAARGAA